MRQHLTEKPCETLLRLEASVPDAAPLEAAALDASTEFTSSGEQEIERELPDREALLAQLRVQHRRYHAVLAGMGFTAAGLFSAGACLYASGNNGLLLFGLGACAGLGLGCGLKGAAARWRH